MIVFREPILEVEPELPRVVDRDGACGNVRREGPIDLGHDGVITRLPCLVIGIGLLRGYDAAIDETYFLLGGGGVPHRFTPGVVVVVVEGWRHQDCSWVFSWVEIVWARRIEVCINRSVGSIASGVRGWRFLVFRHGCGDEERNRSKISRHWIPYY